ncbi:hypothetical protein BT69DRAFT_1327805 [Atractiella rhizophila]|nr:hypothetical protein BT69DRAFT_1327805 [Atractiella rhizophila]
MSQEDASFSIHVQIATQCDLSSNPYVQQLELKVFELESSLERELMDKDKWKKFYKEKDEEVDRLRLDIDKAKKVLPPADSMLKQPMGGMAAMATETGTGISAEDWIKKPVKPYRPIISKEDADYLGIFWECRQAAASTRTGAQNNILDPVQVLHQLVFDEIDNTVIRATHLSNATADVIRNDATLYTRTYLDATKSIKNQTEIWKCLLLPKPPKNLPTNLLEMARLITSGIIFHFNILTDDNDSSRFQLINSPEIDDEISALERYEKSWTTLPAQVPVGSALGDAECTDSMGKPKGRERWLAQPLKKTARFLPGA